ncbi:hypothetical protein HPP92_027373 [Vanilla planifolia]|uniref:Kinesin motor domain-containing protein n=1 Tax=Vanilla planifolia TaxID=51239 RepID=A0A835P925_VANPL|nr:hypothetical protein HPP92_027373 [Vanilla planifolia]
MEPLQTLVPSSLSVPTLLSKSISSSGCKSKSVLSRSGRENIQPVSPNVEIDRSSLRLVPKKTLRQPFTPENPSLIGQKNELAPTYDASTKVFVRIKPDNSERKEGCKIVQKITSDTLSIVGRAYCFDSIIDSTSSQSGTGKTYTMWGPPSAMVDVPCDNSSQGIVPRIFNMLFSEINKEKEGKEGSFDEVQTKNQCRCSFVEIYNEQINDLLDPTLRNLMIKDDAKNAVQVENLNEVYVNTVEEVTQLLVKGLSNRKVGSTSVNSRSSRSHIIFTCVVESWCKGLSSTFFRSSKTSRISFVDLAGIDDSNLDGFGSHSIQEERYIKNSLSKLGRLVNILSNSSHLDDDVKVPPLTKCLLTNILQDNLGGNGKVALICTIFSDDRNKARTLSTLRFGGRAKQIKNRAIVNEISEDDVNGLSDQIRQLKEELIRAKSWGTNCFVGSNGRLKKYSTRESLNHLRRSLNRSLLLPSIDDHQDMDMDVDEEDVKDLCIQFNDLSSSMDEHAKEVANTDMDIDEEGVKDLCIQFNDLNSSTDEKGKEVANTELDCSVKSSFHINDQQDSGFCSVPGNIEIEEDCSKEPEPENPSSIMRSEYSQSKYNSENSLPLLEEPVSCASPRVQNSSRKSKLLSPGLIISNNSASWHTENVEVRSSLPSQVSPIESLAASLHRGLQIIDYHQRSSNANKSLISLSFGHLSSLSCQPKGVDACAQTSEEDIDTPFMCSSCKVQITVNELNKVMEGQVIPSGDAIQRNVELEALCAEQAVMIKQLSSQINLSLEQKPSGAASSDGEKERLVNVADHGTNSISGERDELTEEVRCLRKRLQSCTCGCANDSLLDLIRNGGSQVNGEEFENEKQRWMESESRWISLTEELRMDLESNRRLLEKRELELSHEKHCNVELDDALRRSIMGHARIVEHYADLQEKYDELLVKHRKVMEGIAEVKKAAAKVGSKGKQGSAFASALAAELATSRIEREKEGLTSSMRTVSLNFNSETPLKPYMLQGSCSCG